MIPINNRSLERATGFTHRQIKRWAVAFLEPDPYIGQHSGKSRMYTFNQAVKIYLGGYFVDRFKYTIREAQGALEEIFAWLEERNWLPSANVDFFELRRRAGWACEVKFPELILHIAKGTKGKHGYQVREIIENKLLSENNQEGRRVETYQPHNFGEMGAFLKEESQTLYLKNLIAFLANQLCQQA